MWNGFQSGRATASRTAFTGRAVRLRRGEEGFFRGKTTGVIPRAREVRFVMDYFRELERRATAKPFGLDAFNVSVSDQKNFAHLLGSDSLRKMVWTMMPPYRQKAGAAHYVCSPVTAASHSFVEDQPRRGWRKKYYGHLAHALERRSEVCLRKGMRAAHCWFGGQIGNVRLSPEAESYFARKDCKVLLQRTPEPIQVFNRSRATQYGRFGHVLGKQ
jgi:hypothetical protein